MELIYVTDPMCSWCWGFAAVLERLEGALAPGVGLRYVMGGLAPDSDEPMPAEVQAMVQGAWDSVEAVAGAKFNRDFWTQCKPRRSTYPACRAVLAAESLEKGAGPRMFRAVQRAYYLEARNPSDVDVLVAVGEEQGLVAADVRAHIVSAKIESELQAHLAERAHLGATANAAGFPTLVLRTDGADQALTRGYSRWEDLQPKLAAAGLLS